MRTSASSHRVVCVAIVILALWSAFSCISTTEAGEKVRLTNNTEVVRDCKFIKNVEAKSGWSGSGIGSHNVEMAVRTKAADAGGNVVLITYATNSHLSGEAYLCPANVLPGANSTE
jgi:hypothetical protein